MLEGVWTLQAPASGEGGDGSENQAALAVFSQIMLVIATLTLGHAASRRGINWIGEAGIALLLGVMIGLIFIGFKKDIFMLAILPPIMFEAGFRLDMDRFMANIDGIATLAFLGTLISTFAMGGVVWGAGALGLCPPFSPLPALLFGSVVSATDPVTVLAVFQRLGAHPDLYSLVFGESVLNDAVAMVLYRSLSTFLATPVTPAALAAAAASFVGVFVGSMLVGCGLALLAAAVVKTKHFRSRHMPLESSLVVLLAFASYMLADGLMLSGIVSALFCGIFMAAYAKPNMMPNSRDRVSSFFKLLSTLAEVFVFVYIGASVFMSGQGFDNRQLLPFLGVCFVALAVSRALNVWPCAALVNLGRPRELRIPQSHQVMLWWSGLRGAMAFAIALEAAEAGSLMLAATYCIILATVLINGGACTWLLGRLGLKAARGSGHTFYSLAAGLDAVEGGDTAGMSDSAAEAFLEAAAAEEGGQLAAGGSPLSTSVRSLGSASGSKLSPRHNSEPQAVPHGQQLRQAPRSSGLLRQWTQVHENVFSGLFLDGSHELEQQPSIAGDYDGATTVAGPASVDPRQQGMWRLRRWLGR
ncbi:hypothetical protein CHLNCDRAFT_140336 [Chlorella variabilis]|uniref:Sodium/hydrogen exchanger n=1 Tax=Chlorella variabilis TaxID=554065 RepID=E1Z6T2_CHLVA|nr:hypothetical protein CHLNCDRAFT_140336 [Chlorella variabilis]EFN58404.1 hypothetical protein CHLNCDRAFT_140336 [Chlorella variabilis]|eukprot:XP_005850506.1 hypothetical protein CHLNCDRAFT_140336 [Chlorella variabilis]